jgi:hypothetical protein
MTSKKKSFWLSYDFGLRGNYSGLFNFLDNYNAIDCGNSLAYFVYANPDQLEIEKVIEKIKAELKSVVNPAESDRIYLIWRDDTKVKGRFIFGSRKQGAWVGYGDKHDLENENDEAI